MKQSELNFLLDKARETCGSDYKVAKTIGATPQNVSDWRHERRTCMPEDIALLAAVAGLDAQAWLSRATVERYEGTPKGDRLMKALGKALVLTGAAAGSVGAHAGAIYSQMLPQGVTLLELAGAALYTMYRSVKSALGLQPINSHAM